MRTSGDDLMPIPTGFETVGATFRPPLADVGPFLSRGGPLSP